MNTQRKKQIFLSHSGEDHDFATKLSNQIEKELRCSGYDVDVFNTSEVQYRFEDIRERIRPGAIWSQEAARWESELKRYLKENILNSKVYLLLVTQRSLQMNSGWIAFEISIAQQEAEKRLLFFFPCVSQGADLGQLPEGGRMFQGIDLTAEKGNRKLVEALVRGLSDSAEVKTSHQRS